MTERFPITAALAELLLHRPGDAVELACLARGLRSFLREIGPLDGLIDALVASVSRDLSRQLDAILHHPRFQALESAWRGLWLVASRVDRAQNVRCEMLNCSKEDLRLDFEDSPEVFKSALHNQLYCAEYAPFGGRPFTAVLANFEVGPDDIPLLRQCAEAASPALTPFIAAMSPRFAGHETAEAVAEQGPCAGSPLTGARWRAFRESSNARYVALVFPRCLGRRPHRGEHIERPGDLLWQTGVFALAARMVESFEVCRLPCNIVGPVDGRAADLPIWDGPSCSDASPLEARLSDARTAELGVVHLAVDASNGQAYFRAAPTCLGEAAKVPDDLDEADRSLHRELPILLLVARLAQVLKVLHRESLGGWLEREPLLSGLRAALDGWTHRPDSPGASPSPVRGRHPLRRSAIEVHEAQPSRGNVRCFDLRVEPNWSLDGRFFTIAVDGWLDID